MLKDAVSIPGTSLTYVLNKALKMKPGDPDLYAPGQLCTHKCNEGCIGIGCKDCKQVKIDCTQCANNKPFKLLKTGMARGPSIIFCRYAEVGVSKIRSHKYRDPKTCNNKKRSHTQLDSRKQVIAFQDRAITINIKEAQHPLK